MQSVELIKAYATGNGGNAREDILICEQESNHTTWRPAKMSLAIRGIDGQITHGNIFLNDRYSDLKADFILANSPFNMNEWDWKRLRENKRRQVGVPPASNASFAWVQQVVHLTNFFNEEGPVSKWNL